MAKTDDDVMALVEDELKRNPGASVDDLFERARGVSPAVGKLSRRQFNARYPLQVKRRSGATGAPAAPKRRGRPRKDAGATSSGDSAAAAPKRRGRPRKNPEAAPPEAAAAPKRRGRPPKNPEAAASGAAAAPKRRGRPRKNAKAQAAPAAAPSGLQALLPKRRGRPPRNPQVAAPSTGTGGGTGTGGTPNREGVRQVFMRFANEIAGGGPKEIMRALSNLDRFVDDAIKQAKR